MQEKTNDNDIKRMADLLRQGATLTDLACPMCASPLFRLKDGTLWCGKDEKKVVYVKTGEDAGKAAGNSAMDTLEKTLMAKVQNLENKIGQTDDVEELSKLTTALSELLGSLEKIKRMKS
ncbi:MAG: hypothetical protein NWF04_09085 [Candidatus Bathyarchaeota archaeon]|nr:hypothetical protein [Candidatus Bathyarchaeota archaeon]